jgi:mycothiol synthase
MSAPLPGLSRGLTTRPLTRDDARAVLDIVAACEVAEFGEVFIEIEDVWSDWDRPGYDLAEESLGVVEGDKLIAVTEVFKGRRAEVNVHPDHQGRGIGTALMRWTWNQAARHGSALVGETVSDNNQAAIDLFRAHGYEELWHSWVLELPAGAPIVAAEPPPGVRLRPMRLGQDEQAAYRVIEDAFSEWPNRDPSSYEDWAPGVVGRGGFEPWHLLLATRMGSDGEEVVGACHLVMSGDEGWVNQLAVRRDQRRRGLGRALLASSFAAARERGATRFGLSTDSRTGALGVYERVGMSARLTYTHWAKRL